MMKAYSAKIIVFSFLLLVCLFFFSCSSGSGTSATSSDSEYKEYLGSNTAMSDFNAFIDMAVKADLLKAIPILITMDNTGNFYSREPKQEEFDEYINFIETFEEKIPIYTDAISSLDHQGVFNKTSEEVLKKGTISIASKFTDFFSSITDTKKEMREKTMEVIGHMKSDSERQILFNNLSSRYKNNETDYKKWWINFNNGDYDSQSLRIYDEFYHDPDSDFGSVAANEKNASIGKLVAKKGAELVEKGAELEIEIYKTALPSPLVDGVELAEDAAIVEEIITKGHAMSYDDLKDKFLHFVSGYDDIKDVSHQLGKNADDLINYLKKQVVSIYDDGSIDNALIKATDTDNNTPGEIMIVTNNTTGEITVSIGSDKGVITTNVTPGDINLTIVDDNADKGTTNISAKDGITHFIQISSNENELLNEQNLRSSSSIDSPIFPTSSYNDNSSSSSVYDGGKSSSSQELIDEDFILGKWNITSQIESCETGLEPDITQIERGTFNFTFNNDGTLYRYEDLGDGDIDESTMSFTFDSETKELFIDNVCLYVEKISENSISLKQTEYTEDYGYCSATLVLSK